MIFAEFRRVCFSEFTRFLRNSHDFCAFPVVLVSADKTSVVSADKTSVVSADKTSVVSADISQDIPQALWTQGRPLRGRLCVDNEGGDVLGDDRCLVC